MRVLHVVCDGNPGGGTSVVLNLTTALAKQGCEVAILTSSGSHLSRESIRVGVQVFVGPLFGGPSSAYGAARTIQKCIASYKPDIVHLHGSRAAFYFRLSLSPHEAVVYTVHGLHFAHKETVKRCVGKVLERFSMHRVDQPIFVCKFDLEIAKEMGIKFRSLEPEVIYNGFEVSQASSESPTPKRVVYIGRLVYQKDPLLMVEVASLLAEDGFTFEFIGGGPLLGEVQKRISELGLDFAVRLKGNVTHDEALRALAESSYAILTSRWEGLPVAMIEAMSLGVAVIVPDICGIPEVISSGKTGYLVHSRDPREFAVAIRTAEADPSRLEICQRGRHLVSEMFSNHEFISQHMRVYQKFL